MPVWRCPHCGTPQAETSRCWVCRRSTTCCATCSHFRRGVASGLGLCGQDPRRSPRRGTEIEPCWTAANPSLEAATAAQPQASPASVAGAAALIDERRHRTFVPVDRNDRRRGPTRNPAPAGAAAGATPTTGGTAAGPGRWSLWGDGEG